MQKKVLLIDNDSVTLEFMKIFLRDEGCEVYTAASCAEGRDMFQKCKPEVIVVDVELDDGSGIDFAEYAKKVADVKVIIASGHSYEYLNSVGINISSMDGVLTKPLELSELKAAIQPC